LPMFDDVTEAEMSGVVREMYELYSFVVPS
jgi:hypothetical protein